MVCSLFPSGPVAWYMRRTVAALAALSLGGAPRSGHGPGRRRAPPGALDDQRALEFIDRAEDVEDQAAGQAQGAALSLGGCEPRLSASTSGRPGAISYGIEQVHIPSLMSGSRPRCSAPPRQLVIPRRAAPAGSEVGKPGACGNGPGGARVRAAQPGSPGTAPARHQPQSSAGWRHQVHVDQFKTEADDPQHQPAKGCLVGQLGAKGRGARPTVTSQSSNSARSVRPAWPAKVISYVCDRIKVYARGLPVHPAASVPGGRCPRHHPSEGEPGRPRPGPLRILGSGTGLPAPRPDPGPPGGRTASAVSAATGRARPGRYCQACPLWRPVHLYR